MKINAEKFTDNPTNIKINTGIDISDIKEVKSTFFKTKEELVAVKFQYTISYEPEFAELEFKGNVLLGIDSKKAKEIFKLWKEEKIPEDFRIAVFNIILKKSSLRALQLGEEMNLPPHFPLPSIKLKKQEDETNSSEENLSDQENKNKE